MSYETQYDVRDIILPNGKSILGTDLEEEVKVNLVRMIHGYDELVDNYSDLNEALNVFNVPQEEAIEVFIALSRKYSDFTFILEGRGDDWDDWWIAKFYNEEYGLAYAELPEPIELTIQYDINNMYY